MLLFLYGEKVMNTLYYGDNLEILRKHISENSIDLIYLDPPFKSGKDYNILFEERNGTKSRAQIRAFEDTWHWGREAENTFLEIIRNCPDKVVKLIGTLRNFLGNNDMMAYLVMMTIRLVELYRVLKPTGSIYLHCDSTASHYLKLVMDAIFGIKHFQREIIWRIGWVSGYKTQAKNWIRNHDVILYYTKSDNFTFNKEYIPYPKDYRRRDGSKPTGKGIPIEDTWNCHSADELNSIMIMSFSKEKLGYETQKPEALLERIIKASSNKGDVVLDPFCGCGTAVVIAEKLNRRWIGIDITHLAISLIKRRLKDSFSKKVNYKVKGEPVDLKGAEALAEQDRFQFQCWALGLVETVPSERKVADRGIDGIIYFCDEADTKKVKKIVVQVKSGHINPAHIRDLKGVVEREKAQIGAFVTLKRPTRGMKKEAISSGFYESPWGKHPKIQILTIEELLEGKEINYPKGATNMTLKKARKIKNDSQKQSEMF